MSDPAVGNSSSFAATASDDGKRVAFASWATNLVEPAPSGDASELYVWDATGGLTMIDTPGSRRVTDAVISGDGNTVVFELRSTDDDIAYYRRSQIWVATYEPASATWSTELISATDSGDPAFDPDGVEASCHDPSLSRSGEKIAFLCNAQNLDPSIDRTSSQGLRTDYLFMHDASSGQTRLAALYEGGAARRIAEYERPYEGRGQTAITAEGDVVATMSGSDVDEPPKPARRYLRSFDVTGTFSDPPSRSSNLILSKLFRQDSVGGNEVAIAGEPRNNELVVASETSPTQGYPEDSSGLYLVGGSKLGPGISRGHHGDPVDTATGNFHSRATDLSPPAGELGMAFERVHDSLEDSSGILGPGWQTSVDVSLDRDDGDNVASSDLDGTRVRFAPTSSTTWDAPSGVGLTLTQDASTKVYTLTERDGSAWQFDPEGRLIGRSFPGGESTSLNWDATSGLPTDMSSSSGYGMAFADTTGDGLIDRVTDSEGRVVEYGYSEEPGFGDNLTLASASQVHRDAQPADSYGSTEYVTEGGRVTEISEEIEPGVFDQVIANTYDALGRVASQVNDLGDTLTYHYGFAPSGPGGLVPAEGKTTVVNEASGDRTVYRWDPETGQSLGVTDALGNPVDRAWTEDGTRPKSQTSRSGVTADTAYDDAGRPTEVTETVDGDTRTVASHTYVTPAGPGVTDTRLASTTDAAGVTTTYTYEGASLYPATVSVPCDPASLGAGESCPASGEATTTYTYGTGDLEGLVTETADPDGVRTTTSYNPDRTIDATSTFPDGTTPLTTEYAYLSPGDPEWSETDPVAHEVRKVTSPEGNVTETVLDAQGRVLEERGPLYDPPEHEATRYDYDLSGRLSSVTDPAGATTNYERSRPGDPGWGEAPGIAQVDTVIDPDGVATITKRDRSGDVVETLTGDPADPASLASTTHTYGELGRLAWSVAPSGVKTWYDYDDEGRVTATTTGPTDGDPAHTTSTVYDPRGRVADEFGPETTDPDGATVQSHTAYTYDDAGRVRTRIDGASGPDGTMQMTAYDYDAAGRRWRTITHTDGYFDTANPMVIHPGDRVVETRYSPGGRTVQEVTNPPDATGLDWTAAPDGAKAVTSYDFDEAGRRVGVTGPDGETTTTAYTDDGLVDAVTSPMGKVTDYGYDAAGQRTSVTTPTGLADPTTAVAETAYDPAGNVVAETDPHAPGATDPPTRGFGYTPGGRLESVTDANGDTVDYDSGPRGNRTSRVATDDAGNPIVESWAYDLADRVVAHTRPRPAGQAGQTTTTAYDPDYGWVESVTDPSGRVTTSDYYGDGTLRSQTHTGPGVGDESTTYWVNGRGWQTKMTSTGPAGPRQATYTYDRSGDQTRAVTPEGTTTWGFDTAGNRVEVGYPDGATARYGHDKAGRLVELEVRNSPGAPFKTFATYDYDPDGDLVSENLPLAGNGAGRDWTRDSSGRVRTYEQVVPKTGGGTESYEAELDYRVDGRLAATDVAGQPAVSYDYDPAGQLTDATSTATSRSWAYGTRGNRLTATVDGTTTTYATNPDGSVDSTTTGGTTTDYAYDPAGRRTGVTTGGDATTWAYDASGDPATITTTGSDPSTETRRYNGTGRIVATSVQTPGGTSSADFVWDTNRAVAQVIDTNRDGTWFRTDHAKGPIATQAGYYLAYYQHDHHGSPIAGDTLATAPAAQAHTPFGQPTGTTPTTPYQAYRAELTTNPTTGTLHLRNRDYDPTTGQFTTPDPLDGTDGTPTLANPYHYTNNDPVNLADPNGLRPVDGALTDGQIGAACDAAGGRIVGWGTDGIKACLEPPAGRVEGESCWPPNTPGGDPLVWHKNSCHIKTTEVTCARGPSFLDPVCRNADTIKTALWAVTAVSLTIVTVGAFAYAAGTIGGGAGFLLVPAGAGSSTAVVATSGTAVSPVVAQSLGIGAASATSGAVATHHAAKNSSGSSNGEGETVSEVLKGKKGSIRRAPLPSGSPSWDQIGSMTMRDVRAAAKANRPGFKQILKLLTDSRFNR